MIGEGAPRSAGRARIAIAGLKTSLEEAASATAPPVKLRVCDAIAHEVAAQFQARALARFVAAQHLPCDHGHVDPSCAA